MPRFPVDCAWISSFLWFVYRSKAEGYVACVNLLSLSFDNVISRTWQHLITLAAFDQVNAVIFKPFLFGIKLKKEKY